MKYLVTLITAASFGSASFNLAEWLNLRRREERLVIFLAATVAAARLCADAWL